jgi:hypothetical protein
LIYLYGNREADQTDIFDVFGVYTVDEFFDYDYMFGRGYHKAKKRHKRFRSRHLSSDWCLQYLRVLRWCSFGQIKSIDWPLAMLFFFRWATHDNDTFVTLKRWLFLRTTLAIFNDTNILAEAKLWFIFIIADHTWCSHIGKNQIFLEWLLTCITCCYLLYRKIPSRLQHNYPRLYTMTKLDHFRVT